jgi:predicted AlkP superfamily pyrophosphatase or phosphodiesterase
MAETRKSYKWFESGSYSRCFCNIPDRFVLLLSFQKIFKSRMSVEVEFYRSLFWCLRVIFESKSLVTFFSINFKCSYCLRSFVVVQRFSYYFSRKFPRTFDESASVLGNYCAP